MGAEQFHGNNEPSRQELELTPESIEKQIEIGEMHERNAEKSKIENAEQHEQKARVEALREAVSVERGSAEKQGKEASSSPARRRHGVVSKKERNESYNRRMNQVRSDMPAGQRAFSKFIHNPVVEKTSEVVGSTVARPNSILAGALVAFFLVLAVYLVAKHYGYQLSGFETIGAFIVGWIIGTLYDFFKVMITGKKA